MWQDIKLLWLLLAAILVTIFELLSLTGTKIPEPWNVLFFASLVLLIGYKTIFHGFQALLSLNFKSINLLMTIAVGGAFWLGEYEEGAVVIVLFSLAERLEFVGIQTSRTSIERLVDKMPKVCHLKGVLEPVPIHDVLVGQVVIVPAHALIPLDGKVLAGTSFVDESTITGEPIPADKRVGDEVFASCLNGQGVLEVQVTKTVGESAVSRIREMTFSALKNKAETQKFIETFSSYYTPLILLLAIGWMLFSSPFEKAFKESLTLLVISCPCALVISTPIAFFAALGRASKMGALIKGGRYLEILGRIRAIAFDKTRTLTYGQPIVTDILPFGALTKEEVLECAAGVELFSEHPLGQSILDAARRLGLEPHATAGHESHAGKGARADCLVCSERRHTIGTLSFVMEEHTPKRGVIEQVEALQDEGKTAVIMCTPKSIEGIFGLEDALREESKGVVEALKELRIHSALLTGDHERAARAVGEKCGIEDIRAGLLPEGKAREIEDLKARYQIVAMIGDGVNDAPALATADVGISMTALGSDTALQASNIVILNDHLRVIPELVRLGRRTLRMIRVNTGFALIAKAGVVGMALVGEASLAMAIFADVGVTLLVILNALRLL